MDDRTIVANTSEEILAAETAWAEEANRFHLMENPMKVQKINANLYQHMEVLGCLVGKPMVEDDATSKPSKRLHAAEKQVQACELSPYLLHQEDEGSQRGDWIGTQLWMDCKLSF